MVERDPQHRGHNPAQVTDTKGNKFDTRMVLPVSAVSSAVQAAPRGTAPRDAQRRDATKRFLPQLVDLLLRAGSSGMNLALAGRTMAAKQDFSRILKEYRMTFRQFLDVHPGNFNVQIRGNASRVYAMPAATERSRTKPDGTLVQFARLRPIRE